MIPLSSKNLSRESADFLSKRQQDIDSKADFEAKAKRADQLWSNKGSQAAKKAFGEIKKLLIDMCVGTEICNYCENNEAADVEHIYPKKIFPERAFVWKNYLLACKKCNTTHKQEKFFVFNPKGSNKVQDVKPPRGNYISPPNDDAAFLDPREENPMDYLWLDLKTFFFAELTVKHPEGSRGYEKANNTLDILQLNARNALPEARRAAAKYYIDRLQQYVNVKQAADYQTLLASLGDFDEIDTTKPFDAEKPQILEKIKHSILTHTHPTVWKEIQRQQLKLNKAKTLFQQAPEALTW